MDSRPVRKPQRDGIPSPSDRRLRSVGILAFVAVAVTAGQALSVAVTGEELCLGQGCAVVGALSRISPALFNLFGAAVFAFAGSLAFYIRRHSTPILIWGLHALLVGALGAEGVLFAYQWHVAGAWCLYCLGILAVVVALNVIFSSRGAVYGFAAFAASLTIFSLLSFIPVSRTIDDGTMAVRRGTGARELYLIFSKDCTHCQSVVEALARANRCAVRFNPITAVPPSLLPNLEARASYDPRVNAAAATILGLRTVPILVAPESSGLRLVSGERAILQYVEDACSEREVADPLLDLGGPSLWNLAEDGCGLGPECD